MDRGTIPTSMAIISRDPSGLLGSVGSCRVFGLFWSKNKKIAYSHFNLRSLMLQKDGPVEKVKQVKEKKPLFGKFFKK